MSSVSVASAMPRMSPVPYVALGDSLTHGMQSGGLCWLSQAYSYPKQIADFLGASPFAQPVLKGWLPGRAPGGQRDGWVGNPPNMELVLRRAEQALAAKPGTRVPQASAWRELHDEVDGIAGVLQEAMSDYVRVVEDTAPADLLVEPVPANGFYQNLGVFGFSVQDVSTVTYASVAGAQRTSFRGQLARIARQALEDATSLVTAVTRAHPSLLEAISLALLAAGEQDFSARLNAERVGYVLGRGHLTALDAARMQQPGLVTLWIGNNDALGTMTNARLWDGVTPLYTPVDLFRERLATLLDALLRIESRPYVFLATLPSPTASPNLLRSRLGHWKSLLPSAAFLLDAQLLELEMVVSQYNACITELARQRTGRVWVVDIHALQERMQRATRMHAEATRRVTTHAVRAGQLTASGARAALQAARAGNLETIRHALEVDARLAHRSFTELVALPPEQSGAALASAALTQIPSAPDVEAFTVRLASGAMYRLTGEYLAAGDDGAICQGGAVSLDSIHLTNIGYAYVAREFLRIIFAANEETRGAVLNGLNGQYKSLAQFDANLLRVARDDSLLNEVPKLMPAALDALGAAADLLGELHFSDPYLTR